MKHYKKLSLVFLLISVFLLIPKENFSQTWQLDIAFADSGVASGGFLSYIGKTPLALQSDGKILVTGGASPAEVVCFNEDGILDNTFGTGGVVDSLPISGYANAIVTQGDGKIIVAGYSFVDRSIDKGFVLVRLNTDGTVDSTFGTNGVSFNSIGVYDAVAYSAAVQKDGKIVVAGYSKTTYAGSIEFTLVRYNSNGTLDNTFGTDGIVTTNMSNSDDLAESVIIQSDGKIVIAGYSGYLNPSPFGGGGDSPELARYISDGRLDSTFGTDGIDTIENFIGKIHSLALQSDGKIVAAGYSGSSTNGDFATFRFNLDGSLDNKFGTNGIVTTSFSNSSYAHSIAVQNDGKIVVTGYADVGILDADFATIRFNSDGTLDNTFGTNGIITTPIGTSANEAYSVAIQNDGKIIVAGYAELNIGYFALDVFAVVRYGPGSATEIKENDPGKIPNSFVLEHNYPNPFNPTTTISFELPKQSHVKLSIYNTIGQKVKTLVNRELQAGSYHEVFDASELPSGVYIYKITTNEFTNTKKMILIK